MTRPELRSARDHQAGFTLVELLVAMSLSLVVLLALLNTFDAFGASAARQTRITDANDRVRSAMDRIVRDLRQAQTIEVASPNDLVYDVSDAATQMRRERMCLDADSRLWRSSVTTSTVPVPLVPGTPCPTAGSGATLITQLLSANTTANPIFRYDTTVAGSVRSVGITVTLNAGSAGHTDVSMLRASAFVRRRSETAPAVTRGDITTSCTGSGPLLTLSSSLGPLTVRYTDLNGVLLGSATAGVGVQLPVGTATAVATVTSPTGAVAQIVKTLAC